MKKEHIIRLIKVALKDMFIYRKLSELGFQSDHYTAIPEILLNIHKPTHNEQEFLNYLILYEEVYELTNINEPKKIEELANNIYYKLKNL